jgi:hypothetical protein
MKKSQLKQIIREQILSEYEYTSGNQFMYGITTNNKKVKLELDEDRILDISLHHDAFTDDQANEYAGDFTTLIINDEKIRGLYCSNNQLTTLKLGNLPNLIALYCRNNQLTSLDVSKCSNLKELYCAHNKLTNLKLGKLSNLTHISCFDNNLTTLDVSKCSNLRSMIYDKDKTQLIK